VPVLVLHAELLSPLVSVVRWGPAAEGMIFLARLARPPVDAVEGKPDGVDVDEREQDDDEPDDYTETTKVAPSQGGDDQRDDDLEQAAPYGLFGIEVPEGNVARGEEDGHKEEAEEHGSSLEENPLEAAFQ